MSSSSAAVDGADMGSDVAVLSRRVLELLQRNDTVSAQLQQTVWFADLVLGPRFLIVSLTVRPPFLRGSQASQLEQHTRQTTFAALTSELKTPPLFSAAPLAASTSGAPSAGALGMSSLGRFLSSQPADIAPHPRGSTVVITPSKQSAALAARFQPPPIPSVSAYNPDKRAEQAAATSMQASTPAFASSQYGASRMDVTRYTTGMTQSTAPAPVSAAAWLSSARQGDTSRGYYSGDQTFGSPDNGSVDTIGDTWSVK